MIARRGLRFEQRTHALEARGSRGRLDQRHALRAEGDRYGHERVRHGIAPLGFRFERTHHRTDRIDDWQFFATEQERPRRAEVALDLGAETLRILQHAALRGDAGQDAGRLRGALARLRTQQDARRKERLLLEGLAHGMRMTTNETRAARIRRSEVYAEPHGP